MELLLVAIVALIVFGPRKLPVMAKKAAKMMKEFRSVSNDFRTTWEKEINFEEEFTTQKESKNKNDSENFIVKGENFGEEIPVIDSGKINENKILPEIKEVSSEDFKKLVESRKQIKTEPSDKVTSEKSDWL